MERTPPFARFARSRTLACALALLGPACVDSRISSSNSDPEVAILEPAPDALLAPGVELRLRGTVEDRRTAPEDLDVTWSSSLDGLLLEGAPDDDGVSAAQVSALSIGQHTITLRAVDPEGASGTDAVIVTVAEEQPQNTTPTCAITAPVSPASVLEGETLILQGTVGDAESAAPLLSVSWESSEDGALGGAAPSSSGAVAWPVSDLSVNDHVITLTVTDPEGLGCSEFVVVTVESGNGRPTITAPTVSPNPLFTNDTATCTAPTPVDPEGDSVLVGLRWEVEGVDAGAGATLAGASFEKGESVACVATPSDAGGDGIAAASTAVVVGDTAPSAPGVTVTPATGAIAGQSSLLCAVSSPSTDADGEIVSYAVAWTLAGNPYSGATTTTTLPGDTIPAASTTAGTWTCTVTPSAAGVAGPAGQGSAVVNNPTPVGKLVFVTSTAGSGNLGGVLGADNLCQARAGAAGLSGIFKAWISASTAASSPSVRFIRASVPYVRTDGVQIAANWADLTDGAISAPINVNEFGSSQGSPGFVYSFTRIDGTQGLFGSTTEDCYGGDCHCGGWTSTATQGSPTPGSAVAQVNNTNDDWTDYSFGNFCGGTYGVYCFQQ